MVAVSLQSSLCWKPSVIGHTLGCSHGTVSSPRHYSFSYMDPSHLHLRMWQKWCSMVSPHSLCLICISSLASLSSSLILLRSHFPTFVDEISLHGRCWFLFLLTLKQIFNLYKNPFSHFINTSGFVLSIHFYLFFLFKIFGEVYSWTIFQMYIYPDPHLISI